MREEIAAEVVAELRKDFEARHELFWATLSELKKEVAQIRRLGFCGDSVAMPSHTCEQFVGSAFGTEGTKRRARSIAGANPNE